MSHIDTQEYIFSFENLNGASQKDLDEILIEIYNRMEKFSKQNGIERFYLPMCLHMVVRRF